MAGILAVRIASERRAASWANSEERDWEELYEVQIVACRVGIRIDRLNLDRYSSSIDRRDIIFYICG